MTIHQHNPNRRPDTDFTKGNISYLCKGNTCRLLDGRRTPGYIEEVDYESGMFRWKITNFEDKGNHWDVPFEQVNSYQFSNNSSCLTLEESNRIQAIITKFDQALTIMTCKDNYKKTDLKIEKLKLIAIDWLKVNSAFLTSGEALNFNSTTGSEKLASDLIKYLKEYNLNQQETITADYIVLNPNSGEWIKGMSIVLAELGLISFHGKITRTSDIFTGLGAKNLRESYILHRLAFMRAVFSILEIEHIPLYRGMCSEVEWRESNKTFISFTFNDAVAKSFSGFDEDNHFRNAYLVKSTVAVSKLFMTYLETRQMNERYKEAEALLFNTLNISL